MTTMKTSLPWRSAISAAALALAGSAPAAAVLTGSASFNISTNDYTYSYSVLNTGLTDELVLVSIPVFSPLGVTDRFAAPGFSLLYDSFQGWVNLIEDGNVVTPQSFAPGSTVGPFSFNSATAPGSVTFLAYDASGMEFTGSVAAPVPEATTALLTVLAGAGLTLRRRRHSSAV
jgi:hypothetical protein